jgi:hypothetical protein
MSMSLSVGKVDIGKPVAAVRMTLRQTILMWEDVRISMYHIYIHLYRYTLFIIFVKKGSIHEIKSYIS